MSDDSYSCPECLSELKSDVRVYQCQEGHILCQHCHDQHPQQCGQCYQSRPRECAVPRLQSRFSRNRALEEIISKQEIR